MPLDDATAALIAQFSAARTVPLAGMSPVEARASAARARALFGKGPKMARVEDVRIGVADAAFSIRLLIPEGVVAGVVVYFHGGGWVTGHPDDFDVLGRKLAARCQCAVLLVDYRLAPEFPFPRALEDAYAALLWAHANLESIAGSTVPLIVAGDSAGGNLAAVLARWARERKGPGIALQVLIYPVTDADFERGSYIDPQNQLLLDRAAMLWYWNHYAPDSEQRVHPDMSPLRANDLSDLPPAVIFTAEYDPLRDEGEAYAARLVRAGVQVQFERYAGQIHGFFSMVNVLPASARAIEQIGRAVEARLTCLAQLA